jgi:thiol-disulfide isomerase/thioredoxin
MKLIKHRLLLLTILALSLVLAIDKAQAQTEATKFQADPAEVSKLRAEIEQNPDNLELHDKYLKATGFSKWGVAEDPAFVKQYEEWMVKFPKSAAIPYALGHAFAGRESPKARPYLLKATEIDPKFHKAWYDLWIDGERWGDTKVSRAYLAKAKAAAPENPDYAFYYASGLSDSDPKLYRQLSLEVAKNFPNTERGAQALYWLASRSQDTKEKVAYFEQQRAQFPPSKFNWSNSGMSGYFDLLLTIDPEKALTLAQSMASSMERENQKTQWNNQVQIAENVIKAKQLLKENKGAEALTILQTTKIARWSSAKPAFEILKAQAMDAAGRTADAYDSLKMAYAKEPVTKIGQALKQYAKKLGKTPAQMEADVWYVRDTAAKQATSFTLERYLTPGKASLEDFRGKVVLLTYWFPGCGPCRGEFPHFQNVVNKFKGKDVVYLGLNIALEQDDYVVPFMKSSGYTFIPLRVDPSWKKGNLDNRNAAPVNFLIDQNGKIVFSNFRTTESNEDVLEEMINSMLKKKS